jgi:flagellar biosynthesis anti-sigma factor FlgM
VGGSVRGNRDRTMRWSLDWKSAIRLGDQSTSSRALVCGNGSRHEGSGTASHLKPCGEPEAKRDILATKVLAESADKSLKVVRSCSRAASPTAGSNDVSTSFKHNHGSLSLKPDNFDLNQIPDTDMKKVEALKRAVSEGNYTVHAEDLAPKLMESMFRNTILDEAPNRASGSQLEADDRVNPQQRVAPEVPGGRMVSRRDSRPA